MIGKCLGKNVRVHQRREGEREKESMRVWVSVLCDVCVKIVTYSKLHVYAQKDNATV